MSNQEWPDTLDALVAAPENHRLLFENESVRVLDTVIAPGQVTPLHTHRWPSALYILSWSEFIRRDADGAVLLDSGQLPAIASGTALWSPPLPAHTLENAGTTVLRTIAVELKGQAQP